MDNILECKHFYTTFYDFSLKNFWAVMAVIEYWTCKCHIIISLKLVYNCLNLYLKKSNVIDHILGEFFKTWKFLITSTEFKQHFLHTIRYSSNSLWSNLNNLILCFLHYNKTVPQVGNVLSKRRYITLALWCFLKLLVKKNFVTKKLTNNMYLSATILLMVLKVMLKNHQSKIKWLIQRSRSS